LRWRNPLGIVALLAGLAAWTLVAMRVGATWVPEHWLAQLVFYATAGVAWIWPAARLVRWMGRDGA
jgi:hypothetical protein